MTFAETDLYEPSAAFWRKKRNRVQAEAKDGTLRRKKMGNWLLWSSEPFQRKPVDQALDRQSLTEQVFVAIPRPQKGQREKSWKNMLKLLKRLEIGLLTVALDSPLKTVDVVLTPSDSLAWKNRKKRERLQAELENRQDSANTGRHEPQEDCDVLSEKVLYLCCILENRSCYIWRTAGNGTGRKIHVHTANNVYHWFERVEKGVYRLSEEGRKALEEPDYEKVIEYYRKK
ncbi:MAG: DUF2161 family putative PD-(D/E)XK-type phosphodiesterase [Anaerotignum sp.]